MSMAAFKELAYLVSQSNMVLECTGETTISIEVSNISGWIWEVECFSLIAYKASKAIYVSLQQVWGLQRLLAHAAQMAACAFRVGLRSSIGDSEKSVEKTICFEKNCA